MGGESDSLGIVQEIEIKPYNQMVDGKPESVLENKTHRILWDFVIQTDHLILARRSGPNCTIAMIWVCMKRTSNVHKDRT